MAGRSVVSMSTTIQDRETVEPAPAGDPFDAGMARISEGLASVADVPAWTLTDDTVQHHLAVMLRIRSGVEELTARLAASVVDRDLPRLAGASSPRAWLSATHGMSHSDAARLLTETAVHEGERPDRRCGPTRHAWASGDLTAERAVLIAGAVHAVNDDTPAVATDRLQSDLAAHSPDLTYPQFQTLCSHAAAVLDPETADATLEAQLQADENRARELTQLRYRRVGDGTTRGSFRIPDVAADMLRAAVEAAASPRRSTTQDSDSEGTETSPLTYPQRLGHGFVELIEHLPTTALPQHGVANASIVITLGLDQLRSGLGHALLDTGTAISTSETRRLACNAQLIPAVLDGPSRILDLGTARRLYDRPQRLALALRDGGCIWPGCDRPPSWCEAHHITPWSEGGPTDLDNGCLLCSFHHHLVHKGEWQIRMAPDGVPEVIPPPRLDPARQPRRHQRLRRRLSARHARRSLATTTEGRVEQEED